MRIEGRTFLVTGGASGLGGAAARAFAAAGGNVAILDVNAEAGEALARSSAPKARFVRTDVTSEADVHGGWRPPARASAASTERSTRPASAPPRRCWARAAPIRSTLFEKTIRINLVGTFNVIRLAAAAMAAGEPTETGERGVIVNTASVAAFDGQIGQAAYSARKGGIVGMTLPIARELARSGIRVMTIAPGIFDTPLLAGLPEAAGSPSASRSPSPRAWAAPRSTRRSCGTSSRTRC